MITYSNLGGNQITLVQNEDKMLVWRLFLKILFDRPTTCSQGISSVQNMQDYV